MGVALFQETLTDVDLYRNWEDENGDSEYWTNASHYEVSGILMICDEYDFANE